MCENRIRVDARWRSDRIRDRRESRRVTDRTVTEKTAHAQLEAKSEDGRARSAGFIPFCISAAHLGCRGRGVRWGSLFHEMRFVRLSSHLVSCCTSTVWTRHRTLGTSTCARVLLTPEVTLTSNQARDRSLTAHLRLSCVVWAGSSKSLHPEAPRPERTAFPSFAPLPQIAITHLQPNPLLD